MTVLYATPQSEGCIKSRVSSQVNFIMRGETITKMLDLREKLYAVIRIFYLLFSQQFTVGHMRKVKMGYHQLKQKLMYPLLFLGLPSTAVGRPKSQEA